MLNDLDIRQTLDAQLQRRFLGNDDVVIRHELGVDTGNRRIDMAVLNGHLAGWEIKSDKDTLKRLPGQADSFGRVMDYLSIVTTSKYLDKCDDLLPKNWGIVEALEGPSGVTLTRRRAPRINRSTDPFALAQLLWREEAMDELRDRGIAAGLSSSSRYFVWERLANSLPKRDLRAIVLRRLKQRQGWTGGQLHS
ncbi:sce7726 family protein [Arthrobacter glacialis]|uniref:sce7726 family protein n=1 Tax=Arthrobacter glacialis TaxID=1664 RepID=UPI001056EF81|nr:sce7726 family protein [Arthrobacter glacialis]